MPPSCSGDATNFQRYVSTSTNAKEFQKRDFFYVQDTWRVTPKLTLNLGLRYEFYFPETVNAPGNGSLLNLDTGYNQVAGIGGIGSNMNYVRPAWPFAPRIGIAYQARPTTVIRAGYGRSFDIGVFGSIFGHAATQNLPVLVTQQITQTRRQPELRLPACPPDPDAGDPAAVPANGLLPNPGNLVSAHVRPSPLRLPTLDAWNLALQQSLSPTLSLTIAYVGNKGTHTLGDLSGNTLNPNEAGDRAPGAVQRQRPGAQLRSEGPVHDHADLDGHLHQQRHHTCSATTGASWPPARVPATPPSAESMPPTVAAAGPTA